MYNVTIDFDNAEEAAYLAKLAEEARKYGTLSNLSSGILRDTLKRNKGVTVINGKGELMTNEQLRKARGL